MAASRTPCEWLQTISMPDVLVLVEVTSKALARFGNRHWHGGGISLAPCVLTSQ